MKYTIRLLLLSFCLVLFYGCNKTKQESEIKISDYKNLLDISGIPSQENKISPFGFSDKGAWHAYALPHKDSTSYYGSFIGPLCMKMHGSWLSKNISLLKIKDLKTNTEIDLSKAKISLNYLPGKLEQVLISKNLIINIDLIFISNRSALITTIIKNKAKKEQILEVSWQGKIMAKKYIVKACDTGINIITKEEDDFFVIETLHKNIVEISDDNKSYRLTLNSKIELSPNSTKELCMVQSYYFNKKEQYKEKSSIDNILENPKLALNKNTHRWHKYISNALDYNKSKNTDEQKLIVKCIQTLQTNWRSAAGDLKHDGIFPSAAYHGFYGFWSWDSWKHAVALTKYNPQLAKSSILSMFDFQNERGMIADCVYFDSSENNWRDTKAPLASWAVWNIYNETNDKEFVELMLPKLIKYHNWWYKYRDNNNNLLCEYGSTDGSTIAAKWESGMDNAIRFDKAKMLKNNEFAWSMDQESVDLNAYLYAEKLYIAKLAYGINKKDIGVKYNNEASKLKDIISKKYFNKKDKYFYDYSLSTNNHIKTYGPEGWIPLWANIASEQQAKAVKNIIMDSTKFNTKVPFPTISADDAKFNPLEGYWRGPVWLDQAYFGIVALRNYGFKEEAKQLKHKLIYNAEGLIGQEPIRENYHPITGKGLNANHFSWSAAHYLLLCCDK